jgi:hypothetical protein
MTTMEMAPLRRIMMHPMAASPSLLEYWILRSIDRSRLVCYSVRTCVLWFAGWSQLVGGGLFVVLMDWATAGPSRLGDREAESEEAAR